MSTFEVLSVHRTIAEYVGIVHMPCRFRTSDCPDRCGHAFDAAEFKILSYEEYEKKGEYGDEKRTKFHARLDATDASRTDYQDPKFTEVIKTFSPGQKVKLSWDHIYVTDSTGSKRPERPIRALEPI
jgi:hypothetical protein